MISTSTFSQYFLLKRSPVVLMDSIVHVYQFDVDKNASVTGHE